jgi:hypothetical protein
MGEVMSQNSFPAAKSAAHVGGAELYNHALRKVKSRIKEKITHSLKGVMGGRKISDKNM